MTLWTPPGPCFQGLISNFTARPSTTQGTTITLTASNSKGSYVELLNGSAVTFDVYAIEIYFHNGAKSNDNSQNLVDLGLDAANGGSYTATINNLQASNAAPIQGVAGSFAGLGGVGYYFPFFIKSGTQIGMRGQTDDNTDGAVTALIYLWGRPKYPHLARAGSYVDTFGANTANSRGATVTPGQASEGSWVDVNAADTTKPYWFWQMGFGISNTGMTNFLMYHNDLGVGDGSNKFIVQNDILFLESSNEGLIKSMSKNHMAYFEAPAGVRPYVRSQCSAAPDATCSACVYAVGG